LVNRDREAGAGGWPHLDNHPTVPIRRLGAASPAPSPEIPATEMTQPIPAFVGEPGLEHSTEQTQVIQRATGRKPSLLRASGSMAIATLISRVTGFGWKILLALVIGFQIENDSFNAANTLPNIIFELLLGGVLTSVVVPVLVRAEKSDPDGGEAYVQRLLSLATVLLAVGTVLAVIAAPLLTWIYVKDSDSSNPQLVTAFAYLLMPQIFFYGISALVGAILQSKQIFNPPAWAPVMNNVVILVTIGVYALLPDQLTADPVRMSDPHLLTLGIGVTLGVVAQAAIQIPALRKTGFRFRWRWGWDPRLSEFGGLTLWMLGYVAISQVGLVAITRVATGTDIGSLTIYNYAWMLLQLPYGVIGFSVMTAILPRMSSAAADRDYRRMIDDLSLGNRLSTVALLPISAIMTALGVPFALALFAIKGNVADATTLGLALAVSAFGVLPYAITMMQMRAFNAMKDARTPTLIMLAMTIIKVLLAYLLPLVLAADDVVFGLTAVNSLTFVVGWLVGEIWLRHRLGPLGSRRFLSTLGKTLTASVVGGGVAWLVAFGIDAVIPGPAGAGTGWLQLLGGGVIGGFAIFGLMSVLRVHELQPAIGRLTGLVRRR
jgi:putative peptidoglycan lipid II flippase